MLRNRLKHFRHRLEMNQKEFAEYLGVDYFQYNKWERNKVQPELESIYKIVTKINCDFIELFEDIE